MAAKFGKGTSEVDKLFKATRSGDVEKVREILESACGKCSVNCTDTFRYTPLHWACCQGHIDMVRMLVSEFKADMTIQTPSGATPLILASKHDNVVHALLSDSQCPVDAKGKDGYTALHYSCRYGHVDVVRTLVNHKVNVNAKTDSGNTPLTLAARHGHDNVVHALLSDSQCPVDAKGQDGYTALHYSCRYGHVDTVRTLVNHKANVNAKTDSGDTPLTLAAINKHDNVVHSLSGEVLAKDKDAYTALLHSSCERGYVGIVKTLVTEHKADVNARTDSGDTPLTLAARDGHDNVVHALLSDSQCLVDAKGQDGYTALHYSCRYGHVDIARTLVNHKANVNAKTDSGDTPLTLAARDGHDNVVHALLSDYQCPVDAKGQDGYTALHYSCRYGHVDIARTLVNHKANVNAKTDSGDTPLTLAARKQHDTVVHTLLSDSQCLVDAKGQDGYNALQYSCRYGHVVIAKTLVNNKANVNAKTDSGDTPLTLAARHEHDNVVHALLSDSQCPVDAKGQDGYTALHYSCRYGHVDTVRTLVNHKANVNAKTDSGDTPLTLAAINKHDNVVHSLSGEVLAKDKDAYTALLHSSCERGYVGIVKTLVTEHKADVNARTDSGDTPLTLAARDGHDNVVHALLSDSQCLVDAKGQDGYTALHYSCRYGHVDTVRTLVNHKANVNAKTDSGDTPLTLAAINKHDNVVHSLSGEVLAKDKDAYTALLHSSCERGYVGIVKTLVTEHKADVNARTDSGDTPLTLAARDGHDNVVHALLSDSQCLVDAKGQDGYTALHYSCRYGHVDIARTLVNHKANVNAKTDSGDTPLTLAARKQHDTVVHTLLSDSQCLVDAKGQDGYTALQCRYGHVVIAKTLVNNKANVNAKTDSGDTPLTLAARHEHDNVVHALLSDSTCLVDAKGQDGYTALHYSCRYGHVDIARTLVNHKANVNAKTDSGDTPLTLAARKQHDTVVHTLLSDSQCLVDAKGQDGYNALQYSCRYGHVVIAKTLVNNKANVNAKTDSGDTPLTLAARHEHDNVVHALLSDSTCLVDAKGQDGYTALHYSCRYGHVDIARTLVNHKANVNAKTDSGDTPLTLAARKQHDTVVHTLLSDSQCLVDAKGQDGYNALQYSCRYGHVVIAKTLVNNKANVNAKTDSGDTPLTLAARHEHDNVVHALLSDSQCLVDAKGQDGYTALHYSCRYGHVDIAKTLVNNKANVNAKTDSGDTPLTLAARHEHDNVVHALLSDSQCLVDAKGQDGYTALHYSCRYGHVDIARTLVNHKANVNVKTDSGDTPLTLAVRHEHDNVVHALLSDSQCLMDAKGQDGYTALHYSCKQGHVDRVRTLIKHKSSVNARTDSGDTPLTLAARHEHDNVVHALLSDSQCLMDAKGQDSYTALHYSCKQGHVDRVRTLIKHKSSVNARTDSGDTPLTLAARHEHDNVVHALLSDSQCLMDAKGQDSYTALHYSCRDGHVDLVRTLVNHKADVNVKTNSGDTPLHVAAQYSQYQVTMALIDTFNCDINVKGQLGRSLLHSACACSGSNGAVVDYLCRYLSPLLVDDDGNTPLHTACLNYSSEPILTTLLKYNPPLLARNKDGKTPLDVAPSWLLSILDQYMRENSDKIYADYSNIQTLAKKKYSRAEPITRIFVIGNPGAGKSSLVETLKREGFYKSLWKVSESSVPLHTAGIVPSIHTSKHYGRSLFYDFAGDPEYYSSHAAILENLVSSKKGDNIFMIVVNLREESIKIREILYYWLLFIQYQNFGKEPLLIIVGSHSDKVATEKVRDKRTELKKFCDKIEPEHGVYLHKVTHFILDCRNPKHQHLGDIQKFIASFTKDSPHHTLSLYASTLLGLLEKDFSNEPAFSVSQLQSHIEVTHIALPREIQSLHSLLLELHDIGLLFIVNGRNKEHFHVVFNISKLTNEVHRLLFSAEAKLRLKESCVESEGCNSSFNIGIIPRNVLEAILPENIPKECLVQLQYCQLISHKDVGAFPSLTPSDSTDQSFLFFPALCSVDKSEVSWVTRPDLSYSIGWLARCTDPCVYFPPRFLHVLLLRIVFRFTLSVPAQNQSSGASPDYSHFQRRCTMWKTGVHWLMEEGVECMVELVNGIKEVVVITKSILDRAQNCTIVFSRIITCVMEAKAEFCYSIKPRFFLLDCSDTSQEGNYLNEDNLFAMSDIESVLACPEKEGKEVIVSLSGKRQMEISKLLSLRIFTHWHSLFPIDFLSIHHLLKNVVDKVYDLGLELKVPYHTLEALERNFSADVVKRRREMVKGWMSSTHHPPCWWHLVQALKRIGMNALAEEIQREHSKSHVLLKP